MFDSSKDRPHSFSRISKAHRNSIKKQFSFRHQRGKSLNQTDLQSSRSAPTSPALPSNIVTICVGPTKRLFAAHEEVLIHSPWFANVLSNRQSTKTLDSPINGQNHARRINLPDQLPEVISSVLEYLYKGDYYPRLEYDNQSRAWYLEDGGNTKREVTVLHNRTGGPVLKDTIIYCTADLFGLPDLKSLALRKQGLQHGVSCSTILSSARFAYDMTPDTESRLRGHYLALIIKSRDVFRRSGTMQLEMEMGGRMWFDLFVAMSSHLDNVVAAGAGSGSGAGSECRMSFR